MQSEAKFSNDTAHRGPFKNTPSENWFEIRKKLEHNNLKSLFQLRRIHKKETFSIAVMAEQKTIRYFRP